MNYPHATLRLFLISSTLFSLSPFILQAQNSKVAIDKNLIYQQEKTPEIIDNHNYNSFFTAGKDVYNLKSVPVSHAPSDIIDFKVNPAGYSYAVLSGKGNKYKLIIYDATTPKNELAKRENLSAPSAIAYSPDSRFIFLADGNNIFKLSSKDLKPIKQIPILSRPSKLLLDNEGKFIVGFEGSIVEVYNEQEATRRSTLSLPAPVVDVIFSNGGDKLIVLCDDGSITTYSTRDFSKLKQYSDLGKAYSISIHPDDKYVALAEDENKVQFLNLIDEFDRPYIVNTAGPKRYNRFLTDKDGNVFITFDADKAMVYKRVSGFTPNYTKLMRDQLNDKMREWSKMRPFETEEEYRARMNPENLEKQRRLFANEIATSLAGDLLSQGSVSLGSYNPSTGLLTVIIGSLPPIYLKVPQEDMAGFGTGNNLKFSNAVYGITAADNFELIYLDVFNPTNNKTYTFDNLDRNDLSALLTDDRFVSLDLIMKSNREDVMLKGIKDRIVEEAKAQKLISEHTVINVDSRVEPAFDANGKSINNYRIAFDYSVDPGYSESEDFPSGKYKIESSNAASSLMRIIRQAFETEFASYINKDKGVIMEITGSADGAPIRSALSYDGSLGTFENEPIRVNGSLTSLSLSPQSGIKSNEQLAFMRAQAFKHAISKQLPQLDNMKTDYRYNAEVSEGRGGKFRRVSVVLTFIDIM